MSEVEAPADPAAAVERRGASIGRPLVIALVGLCLIVGAIGMWAVFGRAPQTVSGFGYVVPEQGFTEVGTTVGGLVESVLVGPGQRVTEGQELLRVDVSYGDDDVQSIVSPVDGIVTEVTALPGRITDPGDPLVYLQPADAKLEIKGFIPATAAAMIRPGMAAEVSPADAPRRAQYGVMLGTVTELIATPAPAERIAFIVGGNSTLVDYFLKSGPVIEATVELQQDPSTPSGYAWSIGQGPDVEITAGALSEVTVVVRDTPVIGWFAE